MGAAFISAQLFANDDVTSSKSTQQPRLPFTSPRVYLDCVGVRSCRSLDLCRSSGLLQEPGFELHYWSCGLAGASHPGNADDNDLASGFGQNTSRSTLNSAKWNFLHLSLWVVEPVGNCYNRGNPPPPPQLLHTYWRMPPLIHMYYILI